MEKEGWKITHDPASLYFKDVRLKADLGGERYFAASREDWKIIVEVKDLDGPSYVNTLQKIIGQLQLYQWALDEQEPERELFLAISQRVYDERVQNTESVLHEVVMRLRINLLVFDNFQEVILQWIRH